MPITERTLVKWRKEALILKDTLPSMTSDTKVPLGHAMTLEWTERILRLTQELLDAHLIRTIRK